MVSARQREARKKFIEQNPQLAKQPTPRNPNKVKKDKKKSSFKRRKPNPHGQNKPSKNFNGKHPLRVPGMRPGDCCFICKSTEHIAKLCPERAQWDKHKICLYCRQRGHSIKNCQNKQDETVAEKLCYNCGEVGHSLSNCPRAAQEGGTKFAKCFICDETGHLSKNCPKNTHGIYPNGGSCKVCGGVTHLAKDCPDKSSRSSMAAGRGVHSWNQNGEMPRGKVTKLVSGDDLEDDFSFINEKRGGNEDKSADIVSSDIVKPEESTVKPQKKQGPKVVNFVG